MMRPLYHLRWMCFLAFAATTAQCGIKHSTSLVLVMETDLAPNAWTTINVEGVGRSAAGAQTETFTTVILPPRSRLTGEPTIPGTLVFTAQQAQTARLVLSYSVKNGETVLYSSQARASFSQGNWQQFPLVFAQQCTTAAVAMQCATAGTSCGSTDAANPCVPVDRPTTSYENPTNSSADASVSADR